MKKTIRAAALFCCATVALGLAGCAGRSTLLREAETAQPLSYAEYGDENLSALRSGAQAFSAKLSAALYAESDKTENFVLSPVSVYAGLSLAAACAAGETKAQLLSALGVSDRQLSAGFAPFYRSLTNETEDDAGKLRTKLHLANAVYVNEGTQTNDACLDALAADYFCYSYAADFLGDNRAANQAVRRFVKDRTNGLIDVDFALSEETTFALVNALYLKDVWNSYGNDLPEIGERTFADADGQAQTVPFLRGYYESGRAYEGTTFTSFHADTLSGYEIHFLLPKDGYAAADVFTEDALTELAAADYRAADHENKIRYYTRCLFPAFECAGDMDAAHALQQAFGVNDLFSASACDLSLLTPDKAFCTGVRHVAKLTVNEKGIEGAAATVLPAAGDPGPDEYEEVYLDFTVDRSFGFVLTDPYGVILFSGVVRSV